MPKLHRWAHGLLLAAIATGATASADTRVAVLHNRQAVSDAPASPQANSASADSNDSTKFVNSEKRAAKSVGGKKSANAETRASSNVFIVVFRDEPLASYKGGRPGLAAPPRRSDQRGSSRVNVRSAEAQNYVTHLLEKQRDHEAQMSAVFGREVQVRLRMQHAMNAIIAEMTADEAERVARMASVKLVEPYREYELDTDLGPTIIGAPPIWNGTNAGATSSYKGEGIVVGIIDSGINFGSPSFAATGPVDGYAHANPLGAGNYLGTCLVGGIDVGRCNEKLIGGYDFVCGAPASQCGVSDVREEPGFGDTNGHGSHTASTAAGNVRDVLFRSNTLRISGVAPHANIIAYDVCYTQISTGRGLCPNVSSVAAVNQAVADGVVDSINFSIGGGVDPWSDSVSLAFLSAVDAGIYIAASAGNAGPAANTLGHNEPWVGSTAASQTGRSGFAIGLTVTGPAPVPANLAPVFVNQGTNGTAFSATIATPLIVSPGINATGDGCAAFPANTFVGSIALIRRGTCGFTVKVGNATTAGAIAVVIANNQAGVVVPDVPGTTIPVFSVTQAEGNALRDFGQANPTTTTAQIAFPPIPTPNTVDALGSFSSRGPAGNYNLLKPDVTAPGVSIVAAYAGSTSITGFESLVESINGTSMASPHQAGAATLIRQARPTWTVPEIKSALAMTATSQVLLEDQTTPANPFARGSGRLRVDRAINAGLVLDETAVRFLAADPATGGNPEALNLPSMANRSCFQCTFTRTFRSTRTSSANWQFDLQGLIGTVSPATALVAAGGTQVVTITIDTSSLPANATYQFGNLEVKEATGGGAFDPLATLNLPIAVAVQPPSLSVPSSITASAAATKLTTAEFKIGNVGGSTLNYTVSNTGAGGAIVTNSPTTIASGFRSTRYTDPATASNNAQFAADDFVLTKQTQIASIFANGFTLVAPALSTIAADITWSIYPDAAGLPAGNPVTAPGAAVWTYTAVPTAAGVTTVSDAAGDSISLDLVAAGQNVSLPPGTYWLLVNTRSTFANRWVHSQAIEANGGNGVATITVSTSNAGSWSLQTGAAYAGLATRIVGLQNCGGSSWLGSLFPSMGSLVPSAKQDTSLFANAGALVPGAYSSSICVVSNDPVNPSVLVPVNFTVTP